MASGTILRSRTDEGKSGNWLTCRLMSLSSPLIVPSVHPVTAQTPLSYRPLRQSVPALHIAPPQPNATLRVGTETYALPADGAPVSVELTSRPVELTVGAR